MNITITLTKDELLELALKEAKTRLNPDLLNPALRLRLVQNLMTYSYEAVIVLTYEQEPSRDGTEGPSENPDR